DQQLVTITRGGKQVVRVRLEGSTVATRASSTTGAFVLLGGKGVEVTKFDTLTAAVSSAFEDDTIEIRGNGPYFTDPIDLGAKAPPTRAGSGYAPVIKPSPAAAMSDSAELFRTNSRLTLEGLELHQEGLPETSQGINRGIVGSTSGPLYLTNCKLIVS